MPITETQHALICELIEKLHEDKYFAGNIAELVVNGRVPQTLRFPEFLEELHKSFPEKRLLVENLIYELMAEKE